MTNCSKVVLKAYKNKSVQTRDYDSNRVRVIRKKSIKKRAENIENRHLRRSMILRLCSFCA
jgi:hypothetical protein